MTLKSTILGGAMLLALSATGAFANDTVDQILAGDDYTDATNVQSWIGQTVIKIKASLADGTDVLRTYDLNGNLLGDDIVSTDVRSDNSRGSKSGNDRSRNDRSKDDRGKDDHGSGHDRNDH